MKFCVPLRLLASEWGRGGYFTHILTHILEKSGEKNRKSICNLGELSVILSWHLQRTSMKQKWGGRGLNA